MTAITVEGVSKMYDGGVRALDAINLTIQDGEFMVLVGPSGCGKSTLLRSIAGLEAIDEGKMMLGDRDVTQQRARDRDIAMVFQNYALYPQMSVRQNLEFGLKTRRMKPAERRERVLEVARILGLEPLLDRRPGALSGGQRQRVAMGRAIVRRPAAFLMDEPLSNLDAKLRVTMRAELAKMHERLGVTTVYVTHDQVEAMTLGTRVAVMRNGVIQQCDTPRMLFDHPVNLFVAAFIGSPSMNLAPAVIRAGEVQIGQWTVPLPSGHPLAAGDGADRSVIAGLRPTDLTSASGAPDHWPRVEVQAFAVEELGAERLVWFRIEAPRVDAEAVKEAMDTAGGDQVGLFADDVRAEFAARLTGRDIVEPGTHVELAIDPAGLHFFDSNGGQVLGSERPM